MRHATLEDVEYLQSDAYKNYLNRFIRIDENLLETISGFQCEIEPQDESDSFQVRIEKLREKLIAKGACIRNNGHSIAYGPISPACLRCRTGIRSTSSFISLSCNRGCWFCFNPNQHDWSLFRDSVKDWKSELDKFDDELGKLDFIALTGGEPLLFPDETLAFISYARSIAPKSHIRLYTSGAHADTSLIEALAKAGLNEIRFSLKLDDPKQLETAYELMSTAKDRIEYVLVEMPVIPGTKDEMHDVLNKLKSIGIYGINLLELCFPLHNAEEFNKRGLMLKRTPYKIPYSYGYAGALPVAGSEELALELMLDAIESNSPLSIHWCSLENKNTAQIYAQNLGGEREIPPYRFSSRSFFFETVRAFEDDVAPCLEKLENSDYSFEVDEELTMIAFDPQALRLFEPQSADELALWLASAVIEDFEGSKRFREIGVSRIEKHDLESELITKEHTLHDDDHAAFVNADIDKGTVL